MALWVLGALFLLLSLQAYAASNCRTGSRCPEGEVKIEWAPVEQRTLSRDPFETRRPLESFDAKSADLASATGGYGGAKTLPMKVMAEFQIGGEAGRMQTVRSGDAAYDTPEREWIVRRDDVTVRRALQRWARESGWQVLWEPSRDFPIEAEMIFDGTFREALGALMEALSVTDHPVQARLNSKLRIARVTRYLDGFAR